MASYRDPPGDPDGMLVVVATAEEVHAFRPAIRASFRRHKIRARDIDDLCQNVEFVTWRALERGRVRGWRVQDPRDALLAFMFVVARYLAANARRRWHVRWELLCTGRESENVLDPWDGRDLVAQLEARELLRRLHEEEGP